MVQSILDKSINYPELKKINVDDQRHFLKHNVATFDIDLYDKDVEITVGESKYSFIEKNVIYFPVYLVVNDVVDSQIGVYEIMSSILPDVYDSDGDIDLEKLDEPLLYDFTKELLEAKESEAKESEAKESESEESESEETEPETDLEEGIDIGDSSPDFSPLEEQTLKQSEKEKDKYDESKSIFWIQKFMKSNNYKIIDNEGGGDCLFAAIRDGLEKVNIKITVQELRKLLAAEATQELFEGYKLQYDLFKSNLNDVNLELTQLAARNKELKLQLAQTKDRSHQTAIVKEAKELKDNYENLKRDKASNKANIEEFGFMKGIDNLEKFKAIIQTCNFWGETWAVSTLERIKDDKKPPIKLILLSHEAYLSGDEANVLNCGQLNDNILEEKGIFEPAFYIILDYNGSHYKLITYKGRGAFTFKELPVNIKDMIKNKCLERNAGPYYLIPEFKAYKKDDTELEEINPAHHDENTVFSFYNLSSHKPPGKGVGEKIDPNREKANEFSTLHQITNWRRKLAGLIGQEFDKVVENPESVDILKKTKNAKLTKFVKADKPVSLDKLMEYRRLISSK